MSAMFPADKAATLDDVAEACALLLPIAQASVSRHDWPPVLVRWLETMHDSSRAAHLVETARQSSAAPNKHPKESTTLPGGHGGGDDGAGYGAAPHDSEAKAEPDRATWLRHVGVLDAAAAVRLPQRPSAP